MPTLNVAVSSASGLAKTGSQSAWTESLDVVINPKVHGQGSAAVTGVQTSKRANVGNNVYEDGTMSKSAVRRPLESSTPTPNPESSALVRSLPVGETMQRQGLGYVYDERMMLHAPRDDHWEAPARIHGIHQKLSDDGCLSRMKLIPIRMVRKSEALLVHSEDHWDKIQMIAQMTDEQIVMSESYYDHLSLYVSPKTTQAAQLSCGGVIEAALAVARGELEKSFAIVRPPGHHAEPEEHMGFCFLNNVAVATRVVQSLTPIKRIMILDWDVHHGNGTQSAFLDDPNVLFVSIHRFDGGRFYPCGPFGGMDSCGVGAGEGTSVNIPWPVKGMGDAEYLHAFMKIVMPIAVEFAPDLVIISAGFDAADGDELGECKVTPAGYAHMTHMLSTLAQGKLVAALEGGYNVESIANSALAVTRVLLGDEPPELKPLVAKELGTETVRAVANHQSRYWKNIDPQSCESHEEYAEQTLSIPELLKLYRQEHLYQACQMMEIPLVGAEIEERFQAQVLCSPDLMEKDTLVFFIHQLGDLRAELSGTLECDVELEYSFLLDTTKDILGWVRKEGFSYVEVNTHPRPLKPNHIRNKSELVHELVTYVWDSYIQFSPATKIVLLGHGSGCSDIMDLIAARGSNATDMVKAIVFVIGQENVSQIQEDEADLRMWYKTHSLVALPQSQLCNEGNLREHYGQIVYDDEVKPVKLLSLVLPDIKAFVNSKLLRSAKQEP